MKVIYKYEIRNIENPYNLRLTKGAKFLHFAIQNDKYMVWYLFDTNINQQETIEHSIIGTGQSFDDTNMEYRQSVFDGPFVWHLFTKHL